MRKIPLARLFISVSMYVQQPYSEKQAFCLLFLSRVTEDTNYIKPLPLPPQSIPEIIPALSFPELYDRYAPALYGHILRCCHQQKNLAAYLLHQTFVIAQENTDSYDPCHGNRFSWLFRIVLCVLKDNGFDCAALK